MVSHAGSTAQLEKGNGCSAVCIKRMRTKKLPNKFVSACSNPVESLGSIILIRFISLIAAGTIILYTNSTKGHRES